MSRRVFNPDVYEGHDRLRRLGRDVQEVWKDFHIEVERMIETGDSVVVIETRRGHGQASELQVTQRAAALWTLRDGLVTRMETDIDPSEALAAAGETE